MTEYEELFEQANRLLADVGAMNGAEVELDVTGLGFLKLENKYGVTLQLTDSGNFLKFVSYVGSHRSQGNAQVLEFLLTSNYEADFLKSCSVGMCSTSRRFTLTFLCPVRGVNSVFLNNCLLNFGEALKEIDGQINELLQKHQKARNQSSQGIPARFLNLNEGRT